MECKWSDAVVVVPDGVTRVNSSAFYGCESLQTIIVLKSV